MSDQGAGSAARYVVRDTLSSLIEVILQGNFRSQTTVSFDVRTHM